LFGSSLRLMRLSFSHIISIVCRLFRMCCKYAITVIGFGAVRIIEAKMP
jgi:putative component of membrane protein insertase Oxa1/YidC/SpoIIIJ protein YidD